MAHPHAHEKTSLWPEKQYGVIIAEFLRQFNLVYASILLSFDANTHVWPRGGKFLAAWGIRLATGEFKVVRWRQAASAVARLGLRAYEFRLRCMGDLVGLVGLVGLVRRVGLVGQVRCVRLVD